MQPGLNCSFWLGGDWKISCSLNIYGTLAQLVEHGAEDAGVRGSNPWGTTQLN